MDSWPALKQTKIKSETLEDSNPMTSGQLSAQHLENNRDPILESQELAKKWNTKDEICYKQSCLFMDVQMIFPEEHWNSKSASYIQGM